MKTILIFALAAIGLQYCKVTSFLSYPFIAKDFLEEFLGVLNVSYDKTFEQDLMKHAIAGEKCLRECETNDRKVCFFNFTLKHYQILGG